MRTSKPIATISYNSELFLQAKLMELYRNKKICDWMYMKHKKEKDERKDHIHLWIKPNTLIDTMDLQKFFEEIDPSCPEKPLKCIDFRTSQTDDWVLYTMHHAAYLASKGESREYHYTLEDFMVCDEDTFEDTYQHALKGSDWARRNQILMSLTDGRQNPLELITSGVLPLNMASQLNAFKYMQTHYGLDRGGRSNHEQDELEEPAESSNKLDKNSSQ